MTRLKSEQGSILVLVLAFAAIVGLLSTVVYQRIHSALDTQRGRILRNQYVEMIESMRTQISDPQMCHTMLGGQAYAGTLAAINAPYGTISQKPITKGWAPRPGGVTIDTIQILDSQLVKTVYMANDGTDYLIYRGKLFLNPQNVRINITGTNGRSDLMIPLFFAVKNNIIQGCYGETSVAGQCLAIGNSYDWRNPSNNYSYPQFRCHPQKQCKFSDEGIFSAAGEAAANSHCTFPYRATSVGTFMDTGDGRWFCQWCNSYYKD